MTCDWQSQSQQLPVDRLPWAAQCSGSHSGSQALPPCSVTMDTTVAKWAIA